MRRWSWAFPILFLLLGVGCLAYGFLDLGWFSDHPPCDARFGGKGACSNGDEAGAFKVMGLSFVGTSLALFAIYGLFSRSARKRQRLQAIGKQAPAYVVSVEDTGVTVNDNPRIRVNLQVQPSDEPQFEVTTTMLVSRLAIPQAGTTVSVKYDPDDHESIVFDGGSTGGIAAGRPDAQAVEQLVRSALTAKGVTGDLQEQAVRAALAAAGSGSNVIDLRRYTHPESGVGAGDPIERLQKLSELRTSGALSESEFELAKAKILAEL